jgi:RimJ/RimL family protein N-acetyltransferase
MDDAAILLAWRNHPVTRKFSRQTEYIRSDEHITWLIARLKKVHLEPFSVFFEDFKAIGMSRLDAVSESKSEYEISILVDPSQHGKGVGTKILNITCANFSNLHPNTTIVASINLHNHVSQKLFTSAGFEIKSSDGDFLRFVKKF